MAAPPRVEAWVLLAFMVLPAVLVMVFARSRDVLALLALLLTTVLGALIFLPALGTAGARGFVGAERGAEAAKHVSVLHRGRAGEFDFTVIGATDGTAVSEWLTERGFVVGLGSIKAFTDYVAEGWVFVAGRRRLSPPPSNGTDVIVSPPHPVTLRFATDRAIYPMRLTGADDNGAVRLRLYVFGAGGAEGGMLEPVACLPVERRADGAAPVADRPRARAVIGHAGLLALIGDATTLTRLDGSVAPADMANDIAIAWVAPSIIQPTVAVRMGDPLGIPLPAILASGVIAFGVAFIVLRRVPRAAGSTDPDAVSPGDATEAGRAGTALGEPVRPRLDPTRLYTSRLRIASATLIAIGLLCAGWRMWDQRADVGRRDARLISTHVNVAEGIREEIAKQRASGVPTGTLLAELRAESWLTAPYFNPIIRQRGAEGDGPGEGKLSVDSSDALEQGESDSAAPSSVEGRLIYLWHDASGAAFTIPLEAERR